MRQLQKTFFFRCSFGGFILRKMLLAHLLCIFLLLVPFASPALVSIHDKGISDTISNYKGIGANVMSVRDEPFLQDQAHIFIPQGVFSIVNAN